MNIFIIIAFLGVYIFQQNRLWKKQHISQSFFKRSKNWIALIVIIVIPVVVVNLAFQNNGKLTKLEYLSHKKDSDYVEDTKQALEDLIKTYPDSIELHFEFVDHIVIDHSYTCSHISMRRYSHDPDLNNLIKSYALVKIWNKKENNCPFVIEDWSFDQKNEPYNHYLLGYRDLLLGQYPTAELHFLKEQELYPNHTRNNKLLLEYYNEESHEKLKAHLQDESHLIGLNTSERRLYYFTAGDWPNYIIELYHHGTSDVTLFAIIAALLISVLWMIFLRNFDVYNPEKWRDIITVFVLSALMTNLCIFWYDLMHSIDIVPGKGSFKDFLYCSFVIGISEETVKLIPWILFGLISKKLKEPFDYILYASISALGFAFIENWIYLEDPWNITVRTIMSVTGHMFDASIIAYSFVLMKFRFPDKKWKMILPILGFLLACLSHGFYDVWLISPSLSEFEFISTIFSVISFHIWFYFINNSMNHSVFYRTGLLDKNKQANLLIFGLVIVLCLEYILFANKFGSKYGNELFLEHATIVFAFLLYAYILINSMKLKKGTWVSYSLPFFGAIKSVFGKLNPSSRAEPESFLGINLRLFVRKSNRLVGDKFPLTGECIQQITIDKSNGWYIFQLDKPIFYPGHNTNHLVIKVIHPDETLETDKVEITLLFIKNHVDLQQDDFSNKAFNFTGQAFSRPI